jgi:hypothetical protein
MNLSAEVPSFNNTDAFNPFFIARDWLPYTLRSIENLFEDARKLILVVPNVTDAYGVLLRAVSDSLPRERLQVVRHSDFIPQNLLPTFNDNTILAHLPKIGGLSENFLLLRDFVFLNGRFNLNSKQIPLLLSKWAQVESAIVGHDAALSASVSRKLIPYRLYPLHADEAQNGRNSQTTIPDLRSPLVINKAQFGFMLEKFKAELSTSVSNRFLSATSVGMCFFL